MPQVAKLKRPVESPRIHSFPRIESGIESARMKTLNVNAKTIFLCCLLLGLAQSLPAAGNLFYAEVEIADESAEARQTSIASAFHKVLIKLTGNSKIKGHKGVSRLLRKAPDYMSQYRYRVDELSGDAGQAEEAEKLTRYIQVQFDKTAVERALAAAGIAIWEGSRPEVLLWLAYAQYDKPELMDAEILPEAIPMLQQAAGDHGLPLQLPLMDLQDQAALSSADVWGSKTKVIKQASERYPHDVILTAKITGTEGSKWNSSWVLYNRAEPREFTRSGESLQHALNRGMNRAAELLAQIYAPVWTGEPSEPVKVHILQVGSAADYSRVMDLIRQQSGVSRVSVKQMKTDELLLEVWASGGAQALGNSLPLGGELTPATDIRGAGGTQPRGLTFRLSH